MSRENIRFGRYPVSFRDNVAGQDIDSDKEGEERPQHLQQPPEQQQPDQQQKQPEQQSHQQRQPQQQPGQQLHPQQQPGQQQQLQQPQKVTEPQRDKGYFPLTKQWMKPTQMYLG